MTVLVFGKRRSWPYIAETIFSSLDETKEIGRIAVWRVRRYLAALEAKPDLAVIHVDEICRGLLKRAGAACLPEWVGFRFDLSRPPEQTWAFARSKNLVENLRRIRKGGYSSETTTDPSRFASFYREMYLPYVPRKFGASTEPVGPRFMRLFFDRGQLLVVKKGAETVSGSVIMNGSRSAKAMIIGVKDGDAGLIRGGALAACYYFTILWAAERRYRSMDFGECRPFFDDGLFYFKKRWGMTLERYRHRRNVFGLWAGSPTPAALDFLAGNPFVIQGRKGLEGRALAEYSGPLAMEELKTILRSCLVPGLDKLTVVSPAGFEPGLKEYAAEAHGERVALVEAPAADFLSLEAGRPWAPQA